MKKFFVFILIMSLLFTACLQKNKNTMNVVFDNVEKLEIGSPVNLHGINIGEVIALDLFGDSVLVKINLKKGKHIPVCSKFSITSNPLIGIVSISIEPSAEKIFLKKEDTAKGSYITKGLLDSFFEDSINRQKAKEVIEKITTGIKELSESKKDSGGK